MNLNYSLKDKFVANNAKRALVLAYTRENCKITPCLLLNKISARFDKALGELIDASLEPENKEKK